MTLKSRCPRCRAKTRSLKRCHPCVTFLLTNCIRNVRIPYNFNIVLTFHCQGKFQIRCDKPQQRLTFRPETFDFWQNLHFSLSVIKIGTPDIKDD